MAKQAKSTVKPAEEVPATVPSKEEKAAHQKKRREFLVMKARMTALRQIAKTASDERKVLGEKLELLAAELGMKFKASTKSSD